MSSCITRKPSRVDARDLGKAAAEGVNRALKARGCSMEELTAGEADQVSGGYYLPPHIYGGIFAPAALAQ